MVAQHACVLHPALWEEAKGKLAPTVQVSKMVSVPSTRLSVNHSSLLQRNSAAAVFCGCFQKHCDPSKPLNLLIQRTQEIGYLMSLEMETLNADGPS